MTGLDELANHVSGFEGFAQFLRRSWPCCVCAGFGGLLGGFVTFREYGDVASFCGGPLPCM